LYAIGEKEREGWREGKFELQFVKNILQGEGEMERGHPAIIWIACGGTSFAAGRGGPT